MKVTVLTPAVAEACGYITPAERPYLVLTPEGRFAKASFTEAKDFAFTYVEAGLASGVSFL